MTEDLKVIIIGDANVGKTTLINRWSEDCFTPNTLNTICVGILKIQVNVDGKDYILHIWDTPGQEGLRDMTSQSFHDARSAMIVFDVTQRSSFEHIPDWINLLNSKASNIPFVIVGNKNDLSHTVDNPVTSDELQTLAKTYNSEGFLSSALTGDGVDLSFQSLTTLSLAPRKPVVDQINGNTNQSNSQDPHVVDLEESKKCTSGKCCK